MCHFLPRPFSSRSLLPLPSFPANKGGWVGLNQVEYRLFDEDGKVSFAEARAVCQGQSPPAELASIESLEVNALLTRLAFVRSTVRQVWVGGVFSDDRAHQLSWLDGTPAVDFGFPYLAGEPSNRRRELCLILKARSDDEEELGRWEDEECNSQR